MVLADGWLRRQTRAPQMREPPILFLASAFANNYHMVLGRGKCRRGNFMFAKTSPIFFFFYKIGVFRGGGGGGFKLG